MNRWMKLFALMMAFTMVLCAAGCKKDKKSAAATTAATTAPTTAPTTQATDAPEVEEEVEATEAPAQTESTAATNPEEVPTVNTEEDIIDIDTWLDEYEFLEEELPTDGLGSWPLVTLKLEAYESMTDAERAAYEACFGDETTLEMWLDEAQMYYESRHNEFLFSGDLNLKEIISALTGENLE